jgi:hypothetical protein
MDSPRLLEVPAAATRKLIAPAEVAASTADPHGHDHDHEAVAADQDRQSCACGDCTGRGACGRHQDQQAVS